MNIKAAGAFSLFCAGVMVGGIVSIHAFDIDKEYSPLLPTMIFVITVYSLSIIFGERQ